MLLALGVAVLVMPVLVMAGPAGLGGSTVCGLVTVLVLLLDPLVVDEVGGFAQVQHRGPGADLLDGLVQGGLEAGDVGDEVGLAQLGGLLTGELEVVRLDVGRGHGGDLDERAADGLGQVGDRVEGRRDRQGLARCDRVGGGGRRALALQGAARAHAGSEDQGRSERRDATEVMGTSL